jgi:hypothetical protein
MLFRKLVFLDDWSTVIKYGMPLVERYGPKIYSWIKDQVSKRLGDEGFPNMGIVPYSDV